MAGLVAVIRRRFHKYRDPLHPSTTSYSAQSEPKTAKSNMELGQSEGKQPYNCLSVKLSSCKLAVHFVINQSKIQYP
uniref:Uncharacterized protein n=1 Tax=Cucumis sativus TaxID=3659 RepID=A0A0A0KK84_CUCSA